MCIRDRAIPALIFIGWRFFTFGWFQTHPDSPWVSLWHFVSIKEFLFNLVVLTQRYVDFGRITILIVIIIGLFLKRKAINKEIGTLIIISIFSSIAIITVSIISTNSMGHRYFIASYLAFALLSFPWISGNFSWTICMVLAVAFAVASIHIGCLNPHPNRGINCWNRILFMSLQKANLMPDILLQRL